MLGHAHEEQMGEEQAATMMELVTSPGAEELATKTDLAELRSDLTRTNATLVIGSQSVVIAAAAVFAALT